MHNLAQLFLTFYPKLASEPTWGGLSFLQQTNMGGRISCWVPTLLPRDGAPAPSPQSCWSLVPTQHSRQLGPGRAASLVSKKNLTFGDLVLFGCRMNPRHEASPVDRLFFGGGGLGSEAGCPDAQAQGIPGNADFTLLLLLLCPPAKAQASHGS